MRKTILMSVLMLVFAQMSAQINWPDVCDEDVITNLDAEFDLSAAEVELSWDFDFEPDCGGPPCPPFFIPYLIEYTFGKRGPGGTITWSFPTTQSFNIISTETNPTFTMPVFKGQHYISYRLKINDAICTVWEDWYTEQLN